MWYVYEAMYESDDSDERILVVWYGYVCIGIYKIEDDQYIKIA